MQNHPDASYDVIEPKNRHYVNKIVKNATGTIVEDLERLADGNIIPGAVRPMLS